MSKQLESEMCDLRARKRLLMLFLPASGVNLKSGSAVSSILNNSRDSKNKFRHWLMEAPFRQIEIEIENVEVSVEV